MGTAHSSTAAMGSVATPHPNPVRGETAPGSFRSIRGIDRPQTPEGEGLEKVEAQKLLEISLEGSVE